MSKKTTDIKFGSGNTERDGVNAHESYNIQTTDSPKKTKRNPKKPSTYPSGLGTGP